MSTLVTTSLSKVRISLKNSLLEDTLMSFLLARVICEYLNITIPENFKFEKDYMLDDVATELLGYKCSWPKTNVLRVADLTLRYNGLHKIALSN